MCSRRTSRQGSYPPDDWPLFPGQGEAYEHCLREHGRQSRWIAFIDLDEFLFSPTGKPLPEVLPDYEQWPAVAVNWATFGTSGHRTPPPGLTIENYLRRAADQAETNEYVNGSSTRAALRPGRGMNPHVFEYESGVAVNGTDVSARAASNPEPPGLPPRLRINHYRTRSLQEAREKLTRPMAANGKLREVLDDDKLSELLDETITIYVPALRDALGVRA